MSETIFVTGVVIANGIADSDGDLLTKKDIKTIFTKYLNRETDTMHTNIRNDGVDVLANWISESDTKVDGQDVPSGSWLATFKITNQKLIDCIKTGKLTGLSLGSVSEKAMTPKYWFVNKSMNYRDLDSIEEAIPLFISFVDNPANQFTFEVMEYDAYINKSNENGVNTMNEETEMITAPVSFFEKLFDKLAINKSESEEDEEKVEKAEEETVEEVETTADDKVTALFEKLDIIIEQNNQILEAIQKEEEETDESVDEEEEIEKAEEDEEESSEEKKEEEDDEEVEKSEDEKESDDDEKIEKRQTSMTENQNKVHETTFYQNTHRDHLGRKIRR